MGRAEVFTDVMGASNKEWVAHLEAKEAEKQEELQKAISQLAISLADHDGTALSLAERMQASEDDTLPPQAHLTELEQRFVDPAHAIMQNLMNVFQVRGSNSA